MDKIKIRFHSKRFIDDHFERFEDPICPTVLSEGKTFIELEMTAEQRENLMEDAMLYADPANWDREVCADTARFMRALRTSAKSVLATLNAAV